MNIKFKEFFEKNHLLWSSRFDIFANEIDTNGKFMNFTLRAR